jgi:adenylate kinase family enzyme
MLHKGVRMIQKYLNHIQEGYFFSDKTISIDLNKFENGKSNILLVLGLIGSGKTTLGKYLAKKYKARLLQIDDCISWSLKEHPPNKEQLNDYFNCIEKMIHSNKRVVIEGVGLLNLYKFRKEIIKKPVIIIGKSAIRSSFQAMIRNRKDKEPKFWKLFLIQTIINLNEFQKRINYIRKERVKIPGSVVKEYKIPKI